MTTRALVLKYDHLNVARGDDAVNTHFTSFPLRRLLPVQQQSVQRKQKQTNQRLYLKAHSLHFNVALIKFCGKACFLFVVDQFRMQCPIGTTRGQQWLSPVNWLRNQRRGDMRRPRGVGEAWSPSPQNRTKFRNIRGRPRKLIRFLKIWHIAKAVTLVANYRSTICSE